MEALANDILMAMWEKIVSGCMGERPLVVALANDDGTLEIAEQDQAVLNLWETVGDLPNHKGKEPRIIILPDGMQNA